MRLRELINLAYRLGIPEMDRTRMARCIFESLHLQTYVPPLKNYDGPLTLLVDPDIVITYNAQGKLEVAHKIVPNIASTFLSLLDGLKPNDQLIVRRFLKNNRGRSFAKKSPKVY